MTKAKTDPTVEAMTSTYTRLILATEPQAVDSLRQFHLGCVGVCEDVLGMDLTTKKCRKIAKELKRL